MNPSPEEVRQHEGHTVGRQIHIIGYYSSVQRSMTAAFEDAKLEVMLGHRPIA